MPPKAQRHVIGTLAKSLAAVISSSAPAVQMGAIQTFLTTIQQYGQKPPAGTFFFLSAVLPFEIKNTDKLRPKRVATAAQNSNAALF